MKKNTKPIAPGKVVCSGISDPLLDGFVDVNVCSRSKTRYRELSPFFLGPIHYQDQWTGDPNGIQVTNVENLWQFSKVWNGEHDQDTDLPTAEFFERRNEGFKDPKPHRWIKLGSNDVVLYSFWKGNKLPYLDARKEVYCPVYADLVQQTVAFKQLYDLVHNKGQNVQIRGFDGYDVGNLSLDQCLHDPSRSFGHELVIVSLLRNEKPWEV